MTETTSVPGTSANPPAPVQPAQGTTPTAPAQVSDNGQGSNADAAKARKALKQLERERDDLKAKLDQIAEANKTEAEKAIEKARQEGAAETRKQYEARLAEEKRDRAVERAVLSAGLDADYAHIVKAKLADMEDVTDLDAEVKKIIEGATWAKPAARPGQPGAPTSPVPGDDYPRNGAWDREQIQEVARKGLWPKYRESIEAAQRAALRGEES